MATTQDGRSLQLSTPLGKDFLLINQFRCTEGLNRLFHIELDLLHDEETEGFKPTKIDSKALLGNPMVLAALQAGDFERYFHGMCVSFTQTGRNQRFSEYRAELVPAVWRLTQISQSRIFQNKSVPEILSQVLRGFEFRNELQINYEPRNYCVQYRESDWNFASRLMEEEGIYYYFEHTENSHVLHFADTPAGHQPCPNRPAVTYALDRSDLQEQWVPAIYTWGVDDRVRTGKTELRDFNFQIPLNSLETKQFSRLDVGQNQKMESYDWPGGYAKRFDGISPAGGENAGELSKVFAERERIVRVRQEEVDVNYTTFFGGGNVATVTAGYTFELNDHPISAYNGKYVLTHVQHSSIQSPAYVSEEIRHDGYESSFSCIPFGAGRPPFRPQRTAFKPFIQGSQTAFVVGPAGEEILTDKYGRVKVQFHWDRENFVDQRSSCWLRVATAWAGNRWGSIFIPRIGMEVLVDFMEGDPDQPIITGCVYNPSNMPPYELPEHKTRSALKSNSSKGGMGFNEIRIEDAKSKEQIFVHAQKNMDIRVLNDCLETIKHDRHLIIESDQFEEVKKDKHLTVRYNHNEKIGGTMSLKIGVDHQEKVGSNYALDAGTNMHLKAGANTVIEAGANLTLKVGGSFVNINAGGVFVKGPMVMLNSGGSGGSGSGASPEQPKPPKEADTAEAGKRGHIPRALAPPQPPTFAAAAASIHEVRLEDNVPAPPAGDRNAAEQAEDEKRAAEVGQQIAAARARAAAQAQAAEQAQSESEAKESESSDIGDEDDVDENKYLQSDDDADGYSAPPDGISDEGSGYLDGAAAAAPFING